MRNTASEKPKTNNGIKIMVGFLFDNDGVLIDSSKMHWLSWELLMKEEDDAFMDHRGFVSCFGKRNDLILKELLPNVPQKKRDYLAKRKEELFRECARGKITLLDGMENFLSQVKEANIPRAIASSTPIENLEMYITSTVLGKYFDHYLSAEQCAHGKPYPDIFIKAAETIGYKPEECIVFEDAPAGIEAARRAGCFIVALATTHKKADLKDYDLIYNDATKLDLQEILEAYSVKIIE